jgi:hypothetical protein
MDVNMADEITWRWTANGEYTTKSAYRIQFQGHLKSINIRPIWKAKTEPKCKIFAWILLHRKILTSNNLEKWGCPNDPLRRLRYTASETPTHLCKDCPYTRQVWSQLVTWFDLNNLPPSSSAKSIIRWWKRCRSKIQKRNRSFFDGIMIYFW